jgi:hypothetical protein
MGEAGDDCAPAVVGGSVCDELRGLLGLPVGLFSPDLNGQLGCEAKAAYKKKSENSSSSKNWFLMHVSTLKAKNYHELRITS